MSCSKLCLPSFGISAHYIATFFHGLKTMPGCRRCSLIYGWARGFAGGVVDETGGAVCVDVGCPPPVPGNTLEEALTHCILDVDEEIEGRWGPRLK